MGWKIGGNALSFSTEPSSARMSAADTFCSVMESSVTDSISGREAMIRSCDSVRTRAPLVAGHGNSVRCRTRMTGQPNMTVACCLLFFLGGPAIRKGQMIKIGFVILSQSFTGQLLKLGRQRS